MNPVMRRRAIGFLALSFLAATVRCFPIVVKGTWKPENKSLLYQTDSPGYEQLGIQMMQKGWSKGQDDARTPLYPWFIASLYQILGSNPFWVVLAQILLTAVCCMFLMWIGILLDHERLGKIAALIWSFSPAAMIYSNYIYTEALYTFTFLGSCALLLAFVSKHQHVGFLIGSGVGFALSTLARPINTIIPIVLILAFAYLPNRSWRRFLSYSAIFLISYGICLAPRLSHMKKVTGGVMVSTMMHPNLQELVVYMDPYLASQPRFDPNRPHLIYRMGRFFLGRKIDKALSQKLDSSVPMVDVISAWKGKLLEKILMYPGTFTKMYAKGIFTLFLTPASNDFFELWGLSGHRVEFGVRSVSSYKQNARHLLGNKSSAQLLYMGILTTLLLVMYAFFLIGSYAMVQDGKTAELLVFVLPLLVLTIWVGTHGTLRYRVPMEPLILIVALYGYFSLRHKPLQQVLVLTPKSALAKPSIEPVLSL